MPEYLTPKELEGFRKWSTCTLSNAIELFTVRPRNQGFMLPGIQCRFPEMGPMIGYAATAIITAESPEGRRVPPPEWWAQIQGIPEPRVAVIHDLDYPPMGSFWGEVNANIHQRLGFVGVVTDGAVRDLVEVKDLGFHFFSSCVTVSHAYVHLVDVGIPIRVGGLLVKPGDLIMGDRHGVLSIRLEVARDLPKAVQMMEDWERRVVDFCQSDGFHLEGLKERYLSPRPTWPPSQ